MYNNKFFGCVFFIFALFPYVSFGINTWDTQPFFIIFGIIAGLIFISTGPVFYKSAYLMIITMLILLTLAFKANSFDFIFFRGVSSYLAFFATLIVSIIFFQRNGVPIKLIVYSNIIYILVAITQALSGDFKNDIFSFLVLSNSFADGSRGVIGLTPEPTIFAILMFFMTWIYLIIYDYKPPSKIKILIALNLMTILFLAKSSMVYVYFITTAFFYLAANLQNKKVILIIFGIFVFFIASFNFMMIIFPESRFVHLSTIAGGLDGNIIERIIVMINFDASINDRVLNVVFPYLGFLYNYGLPGGLHNFFNVSKDLVELTDGYFWAGLGSNKILSFVGAFIFELGVLGVYCFYYLYNLLKDKNSHIRFFELSLLFVILNSSIPVAFPYVAILMALLYFKKTNY